MQLCQLDLRAHLKCLCVVFHKIYIYNPCRLNKIGKNPNIMAHKEEQHLHDIDDPELTINSVVNALALEASKEEPMYAHTCTTHF